jgi:hypothetical protein
MRGTGQAASAERQAPAIEMTTSLTHLNAGDTVGVAHLCRDGQSEIDVPATTDPQPVIEAMEKLATRKKVVVEHMRGDSAQQQVLRLIGNAVQSSLPQPFATVISMGGKQTAGSGTPSGEEWAGFMEVSALNFGTEKASGAGEDVRYAIHGAAAA